MLGVLAIAWLTSAPAAPSSPFSALADEYLDAFASRHPSIAAGNGIHDHDDKLEDFSASAVASEVTWLRAFASRLDALDPARLDVDEQVDRRILIGIIGGWLLDLETVTTWTRNPMIYAAAISDFFKSPEWTMNLLLGGACALILAVTDPNTSSAMPATGRRNTMRFILCLPLNCVIRFYSVRSAPALL